MQHSLDPASARRIDLTAAARSETRRRRFGVRSVRGPDLRQEACGMKLRQDSGVHLVGLDPRMGDGLHLQRVRDDDPRHERCQKPDDGRSIARRFQNDFIIRRRVCPNATA